MPTDERTKEALKVAKAFMDSYNRRTQRHITFEPSRTIIHASDKDKIYIPSSTGELFTNSSGFVDLVIGPYGSGKSTMCVQRIVRSACNMPYWFNGRRKSRWAVVRNTSGELNSTTLQTWLTWFGDLGDIKKRQKPLLTYEHMFNDGNGIVELDLIFIALDRPDDVRKIKSLELTGAYLNELSELPQNVLSHFKGRVNGRYPSKSFCAEPYWSGIIADSNPPDEDHWIYQDFEVNVTPNYNAFHQPSGLIEDEKGNFVKDKDGSYIQNVHADNAQNLSSDYYPKLAEKQSEGFIKVYCGGKYGLVESGKRVYSEFNYDIHSVPKLEAIQGESLYLGWDFGLCYSNDTEVLTNNGWKFFKDVDENVDLAATRNPITKEFEYTKINFKTEYDWDGDLLEWSNTEVNFCVTPEHQIPFTYRDTPEKVYFKSAQWLSEHHGGHHYVDLCSEWKPDFNDSINYYGMNALTYCEMMGLYLSEGYTQKTGDSYRITIYQNKQNPAMQKILDNTGLKWRYEKGKCWRVTDNLLGPYLMNFGLAGKKFVPQDIKDMPSNYIKAFIFSYTMGDGHIRVRKNGSIEHTLFTISKRMADDFQELAQKAGWNSSLRIVKPQTSIIIENGVERLIVNNGGYSICFKKSAKRAELLNRNFKRIPYKNKIYCLNVPYHTLYVRRNGKPSWNGNTPACVVVQITARGQVRCLKEYVAEDIGIKTFAKNIVIPRLAIDFPYCKISEWAEGDPSGAKGDEIMEELSCIGELCSLGIPTRAASTNDPDVRINSVRYFLNLMIDGKPAFLISREGCPILVKGFMSGYHFKRLSISGDERYQDKPNKNKYSHPHDALQYRLMPFASERPLTPKPPAVDMSNPVMRWQN